VDSEGYVFIVDRAKDIIISGENIAMVEVGKVLIAFCRERLARFKVP